jgi:hypothetical protein
MKKVILKFILPLLIICGAIVSIGVSCGPGPGYVDPIPAPCDSTATKFMTLYNASGASDSYTWDMQVYEYTFKSSVAASICAIGYQGHPALVGINAYKIEIIDASSGSVLSTGTYSFPSANRGYKNLGATVPIAANTPYIVRRTVVNWNGTVVNTISHHKRIAVPFVNGTLTITGTKTYEIYTGTPTNGSTNDHFGCIDIVIN